MFYLFIYTLILKLLKNNLYCFLIIAEKIHLAYWLHQIKIKKHLDICIGMMVIP